GTGIGLSVAKKLTEILGGEIRVDSKEGEGSTFYFTIPYLGEKTIRPAESFIVSSQKKPSFPGKTILIVEDDDSSFEYLQIVLKKLQLIILWAKNGIEAIELSKSNPEIDLVLMDVKMPGMSGYEATKQIKKIRPGLPIIAQTAYALYKDKEKSEEAGCDDYITKPIQKELLMKFLEKYLIKN
ncbi:MAG: response regulator, partial [Bacteroidales bacterium]|nr:response regulator [Bacteroidales bacterium]